MGRDELQNHVICSWPVIEDITQHFPANTKYPKLLMVFIRDGNMKAKALRGGQMSGKLAIQAI